MTDDPELTREEAIALADDLGLQLYRAEDRVAFVREQLTGRTEPVEPATVLVWLDHEHCPRAESERQQIARLTAERDRLAAVLRQHETCRTCGHERHDHAHDTAIRAEYCSRCTIDRDVHDFHPEDNPLTSTNTTDNPEEPR